MLNSLPKVIHLVTGFEPHDLALQSKLVTTMLCCTQTWYYQFVLCIYKISHPKKAVKVLGLKNGTDLVKLGLFEAYKFKLGPQLCTSLHSP